MLAAGHELPQPLADRLERRAAGVVGGARLVRAGAADAGRVGRAGRRSLRARLARPRPGGRLPVAAGDPDRGPETRAGRARARLLRRGANVHGRRARARAAPGGSRPRRARAQRALRDRAQLAGALPAAGPDGRPARHRARPRPRFSARWWSRRPPCSAPTPPSVRRLEDDEPGRERRERGGRGVRDRHARSRERMAGRRHRAVERPEGGGRRRPATGGCSTPTRSWPRGTRPTWACRCSAREGELYGVLGGLRASARGPGCRRRSRRSQPWPGTRPQCSRTPTSTRRSRTSRTATRRSSRTSPTASSPSTARARSCCGTPPPSRSRASRQARRSAARRHRCCSATSSPGSRAQPATGSSPIRRGGDEVWLSVSEAVMRDPAGCRRRPDLRLPRRLRRSASSRR